MSDSKPHRDELEALVNHVYGSRDGSKIFSDRITRVVTATVETLAAVTAERDAAREEQREACALHLEGTHRQSSGNCNDRWNATVASGATTTASPSCGNCTRAAAIRATPLTATPLADRIKELEAELAEVRAGRDALEASDECGVDGIPPCHAKPNATEADWCRMCLVARYRQMRKVESELHEGRDALKAALAESQKTEDQWGRDAATYKMAADADRALAEMWLRKWNESQAELATETALVEATRAEMVRQAEIAHDSARADRERIGVLEAAIKVKDEALEWFIIQCETDRMGAPSLGVIEMGRAARSATPEAMPTSDEAGSSHSATPEAGE